MSWRCAIRIRFGVCLATGAIFSLASTACAELLSASPRVVATHTKSGSVVVIGNVRTILDGQSTGTQMLKVPPGEFAAALGAASLTSNPADQGETLVLGNTCFVKSVSPTEDYRTTSSRATSFSSGFVAGIPPGVRPTAHYGVAGRGQSMESIYKDLARRHGPFFAVTARGHFSRIEASAVKRAPGYGEPILGANKERYFHPSAVMSDVDAFTFGLVLRSPEDATTQTKRIFYINPDDRGTSGMLSHTHFGVLRSLKGVDPANPASAAPQVSEVAHLLTQSIVTSGEFDVYELSDGVR